MPSLYAFDVMRHGKTGASAGIGASPVLVIVGGYEWYCRVAQVNLGLALSYHRSSSIQVSFGRRYQGTLFPEYPKIIRSGNVPFVRPILVY